MPNINLPTGNTIYVSAFEYFILLDDKDVDEFFQSCIADDLGVYIDNPFSNTAVQGKLDIEDVPENISPSEDYEEEF